jgi:hypothetical protein
MMEGNFICLEMTIQHGAQAVVEQSVHDLDLRNLEEPIQDKLRTQIDQILATMSPDVV